MSRRDSRNGGGVWRGAATDAALDEFIAEPTARVVEELDRLGGDILVLGVAGKMGVTLAMTARRALDGLGGKRRVVGVARFSEPRTRETLEAAGVETIECDLLDRAAVGKLPRMPNVIFMVGRKFGTSGAEHLTWAVNTVVPANVAEHFRGSRIVAFSTGCVYPLVDVSGGGSLESDAVGPLGEYAQSCVARERVFEHFGRRYDTPVCLLRLNYAIDLRYGVLHDIARAVRADETIDLSVGYFNCIWQGEANCQALLALGTCAVPAEVWNITGADIVSVRDVAERFAARWGRTVRFAGAEGATVYLNNAARAHARFGKPQVDLDSMVAWTADWLDGGGSSLEKPTGFGVRDGAF